MDRVLLGRDNVRGATLQWERRKASYIPCRARTYPQNRCNPKPACELVVHRGREQDTGRVDTRCLGELLGRGPILPAASLQSQQHPAQISGCSESWDSFHLSKTDLGFKPRQHLPPVPIPTHSHRVQRSPHLSGNVIGSLGRCVGYLGGYHHHLGSSWIHMGGRAGPSRRVTLHAGCTGRRLCPVLVEMLGERWGTASGAPVPSSATTAHRGETPAPLLCQDAAPPRQPPRPPPHPGTIPSPRTCGAAWVHPTQLMPGAAPAEPSRGRQLQRPGPATTARSSAAGPRVLCTGSRRSRWMLGPVVPPCRSRTTCGAPYSHPGQCRSSRPSLFAG